MKTASRATEKTASTVKTTATQNASARGFQVVRKATGLSQAKFAAAIGVSKATVENIELGRAPVTPKLEETLGVFAGVVPGTLVSDSCKPRPLDFNRKPYSRQSWE